MDSRTREGSRKSRCGRGEEAYTDIYQKRILQLYKTKVVFISPLSSSLFRIDPQTCVQSTIEFWTPYQSCESNSFLSTVCTSSVKISLNHRWRTKRSRSFTLARNTESAHYCNKDYPLLSATKRELTNCLQFMIQSAFRIIANILWQVSLPHQKWISPGIYEKFVGSTFGWNFYAYIKKPQCKFIEILNEQISRNLEWL